MDDRLALLVGRIILAWGELDQTLYALLRKQSLHLGEPLEKEGRFNQRRKLFRRKCTTLAPDEAFAHDIDKFMSGTLQPLETKRGEIAHGMVLLDGEQARFLHTPDAFKAAEAGGSITGGIYTFDQLEALERDIRAAIGELGRLAFDATFPPSEREKPPAPPPSRRSQNRARQGNRRPSTTGETDSK